LNVCNSIQKGYLNTTSSFINQAGQRPDLVNKLTMEPLAQPCKRRCKIR